MIEHHFTCPYCFEFGLKLIDFSIKSQNFIEDCEVCCNPIEFNVELQNGIIISFEATKIGLISLQNLYEKTMEYC